MQPPVHKAKLDLMPNNNISFFLFPCIIVLFFLIAFTNSNYLYVSSVDLLQLRSISYSLSFRVPRPFSHVWVRHMVKTSDTNLCVECGGGLAANFILTINMFFTDLNAECEC